MIRPGGMTKSLLALRLQFDNKGLVILMLAL